MAFKDTWGTLPYEEKEEIVDRFLAELRSMMLGKDVLRMSYTYYADSPPDIRDGYRMIPASYCSEDRIEIELTKIRVKH